MIKLLLTTFLAYLALNSFLVLGQETEALKAKEDLNWIGVSFGLPFSLRVGVADVFAEDVDLRVDGFISHATVPTLIIGGAANIIYSPDVEGFQPYVGGGTELSFGTPSPFIKGRDYSGTYLGILGFGGIEVGFEHIKLFAEAGVGISTLLVGEGSKHFKNDVFFEDHAPSILYTPRASIGINFLF